METKIISYTNKFAFMYQIYFPGYIIETTKEDNFHKLVDYICLNDYARYDQIPAAKRLQIECVFTVRMSR